jgi:hypothetical protein
MNRGQRIALLGFAFVFVACIATLGTLYFMTGAAVDVGVLDASWTAPTTNTDGSPLTDLVSYRVYYGTSASPCPSGTFHQLASAVSAPSPNQTVHFRLTGLTMGQRYHVAIVAVNLRGATSVCSIVASAPARRP